MADEPDNLVLQLLREMRADLRSVKSTIEDHSLEFKSLHKKIDDWQETTATGIGLAAHANLRTQALDQELESIKERLSRLEGRH